MLSLGFLGDMEVLRDGLRLSLPQSKKTRALLAYLAVTGRPHRRDRLCSLFWELPDDPRGSLRWSLSKLRPLVDEPMRRRLVADRETVAFAAEDAEIDLLSVARRCGDDPRELDIAALEEAARAFRGSFLEGVELAQCPDFTAWCVAERERARQLHRNVLQALIERLEDQPGRAAVHARALVQIEPLDEEARAELIRLVGRTGHREEAARHYDDGLRLLDEAGIRSAGLLKSAWREVKAERPAPVAKPAEAAGLPAQEISYCTTPDGVRIAYSSVGQGPPIVKAANWLNHLEFDWQSPVWRHWLHELMRGHRLIRYDERGNGLSDWTVADMSFDALVQDLETVVDAAGLDRFTLFGISQGCAFSIAYAVRHPERVERLILYGGYAQGWRKRGEPAEIAAREAMLTLVREGWGQENPAFRQLFTSRYIPDGTAEEMQWWNDLQRISASPENAVRLMNVLGTIDVTGLLSQLSVPTLVVHCRGDAGVPYAQGELLARAIPGARFVTLDSRNHLVLEHEPAWPVLVGTLRSFLAHAVPGERAAAPVPAGAPPAVMPPASRAPAAAPLVGRTAELALLRAALADVRNRRRQRVLLLTGDSGLGKSRLLSELVADTRRAGGTVLDGCAYEIESGRPFGPWIDALRRLPAVSVGAALGVELAPLLPELSGGAGGDTSRDRLFAAVAELIAERGRVAPPVLLVMDDCHWLDEASAALLHYVARMSRDLPVLIVLTARAADLSENGSLARALRALRREIPVDDIALSPLSPDATAELARSIEPGCDVERVYAESAGNPLFALEVARALSHRPDDLPQSLSELVRDRVSRLPETAMEVLRWAALLGPEFGSERLSAAAGLDADALVCALETLQRHSLLRLEERARRPGSTYRFVHDLVRRAVLADISPPRRRLMHGRIAAMLAAAGESDGEAAAEIVVHAVAAGETALAARACVAAGRRCLRLFANAEAAALAGRGMALAELLDEPEQTKLVLELMQVSLAADRPKIFDDTAALLETLAGRALDHGCLAHARLGYQLISFLRWEGGNWSDAERQALRAELVSRSADERDQVLGMAEAARCLAMLERDLPLAEALLLEAEAIATRIGMEPVAILDGRGMLRLHQGALDEAMALFERARLAARRDGDRRAEFMALEHLVTLEMHRGRHAEARSLCAELVGLGAKLREGSEAPFARVLCALANHAAGEPRARAERDAALQDLRAADAKHRLGFALTQAAAIELARGDHAAAAAFAEEAVEVAEALGRPSDVALARATAARAAAGLRNGAAELRHAEALQRLAPDGLSAPAREAIAAALAVTAGVERRPRAGGALA